MIANQLTDISYTKEKWHKNLLPREALNEYHERLLVNGNIITYMVKGQLKGYIEAWRINTEQMGRIVLGLPILTDVEDILNGPICYISNMWIDEEYRNGEAFSMLGSMFLTKNKDAQYFVTFRRLKHSQPIQIYTRQDLIRLYTKGV